MWGGEPPPLPPHCFAAAVWAFVWVGWKRGVERDIVNSLCSTNHPSPPPPTTYSTEYRIHNTKYRIQNTEYEIQTLMYIKLPIYLFLYMALGVNDFDAGKSITRAIGRGGP
jgi:hypothetical protein